MHQCDRGRANMRLTLETLRAKGDYAHRGASIHGHIGRQSMLSCLRRERLRAGGRIERLLQLARVSCRRRFRGIVPQCRSSQKSEMQRLRSAIRSSGGPFPAFFVPVLAANRPDYHRAHHFPAQFSARCFLILKSCLPIPWDASSLGFSIPRCRRIQAFAHKLSELADRVRLRQEVATF